MKIMENKLKQLEKENEDDSSVSGQKKDEKKYPG